MKQVARGLFLWSWILTLPAAVLGGYWVFHSFERYYTFGVRYDPAPFKPDLDEFGLYEYRTLFNRIRVSLTKLTGWKTDLETIRLYVSEAELSRLNARMPQSGLRYVKGRLMVNGKLIKAKFRYRGDFMYHWTYHKKSIRIKTSKGKLYQGIRAFNLQAPKFPEQLNNFLAFKLAREMGLLAPRTKLIRFFLNEKDMGIYIFIEQLKEMTLRHNGLMPGDIYRGEIMGPRDSFIDSGVGSLFETAEVWDKVSVNNHYPLEHKAPLSEFLRLIQHKQSPEAQKALGNLLDMDAWGKFSAFEALAQTDHFHSNHNYRIYFDPWRGKFIPIVWDPIGWNPHWKAKPGQKVASERIQHNLHAALFMNGDFQRARHQVLRDFFNSGKDVEFLALASKSIAAMEREIPNDPLLRPGNPQTVKANMKDFFKRIRQGFADIKETTGSGPPIQFHYKEGKLNFSVPGNHPLWRFRMIFDQRIRKSPKVQISYRTPAGIITVPVSDEIQLEGNQLTLTKGFLPNFKTTSSRLNKKIIKYEVIPGNYEIAFADFNKSLQLISLQVDRGRDWEEAVPGSPSPLRSFESLYAPVPEPTIKIPLVWSGNVQIKNVKKIQQPLIIKAGTRIHMGPGASLILEGRVLAQGTARNPIRFLPATSSQSPWGTVALTGRKANGSIFTHCLMEGGSGFKGKILEYSAMLSIHDVQKVTISDCVFRDNGIADDMVHAVYSDIQVIRTKFKGAFSDALDLDISDATIRDCFFEKNNNDGIDLMTTRAIILNTVLKKNGDKGVSVGEGSQMLGVNNYMAENNIAVQSKDHSTALLFNHTLTGNKVALDAYKKNWRYGGGGTILVSKSRMEANTNNAAADKHSQIQIFDTFMDHSPSKKNIAFISVDSKEKRAAADKQLLPEIRRMSPGIARSHGFFEKEYLKFSKPHFRGARLQ